MIDDLRVKLPVTQPLFLAAELVAEQRHQHDDVGLLDDHRALRRLVTEDRVHVGGARLPVDKVKPLEVEEALELFQDAPLFIVGDVHFVDDLPPALDPLCRDTKTRE